jgi:aerobic-type carbon monoxide dehydrogenase small subunit (CoxS/CutS family)
MQDGSQVDGIASGDRSGADRSIEGEASGLVLRVDGKTLTVPDDGGTLLDALRDRLDLRSVKDGCSPQGQCGCCTVLVDGAPRVACVTPVRRVAGRDITTIDGLDPDLRDRWGEAFCETGGSQCGFCTPGIILRLEGLRHKGVDPADRTAIDRALAAHLCRCTGWQSVREAYARFGEVTDAARRDLEAATRRATIEGGRPQRVGHQVALGDGGFADDLAPEGALVAVPDRAGGWVVGETLFEARARAGKVQGRRTTVAASPPLDLPPGDWDLALRTSWVEPAYLETDASWCQPGGEPASPLANGGAFGAKHSSEVMAAARRLADEHGRPVRVRYAREDCVRLGAKRPPIAAGLRLDGSGIVRVARTPGIAAEIRRALPGVEVEEVEVVGPPTSSDLRGAGWAEGAILADACRRLAGKDTEPVRAPAGGAASAAVADDGLIHVRVACGDPLDEVVLRSYCIGAAHQALGWVTSEGLVVDEVGEVHDLTIRSFGILPAAAMPRVRVDIDVQDADPVNGSDAVFAAVAAAVWAHQGFPADWPTRR